MLEGTHYLQIVARGLQAVWLVSVVVALWRRRLRGGVALLASLPALFLGVHLLYQVDVYYPRHVVAGHIAMALVALTVERSAWHERHRAGS